MTKKKITDTNSPRIFNFRQTITKTILIKKKLFETKIWFGDFLLYTCWKILVLTTFVMYNYSLNIKVKG